MARMPERVFRALLRLFPREFRGDFGEQMAADFRDQHENGEERPQRLWLRTAADLLYRAPLEHLDILKRDAGYAVRLLKRRPGFTASALLTLALGIGLNTAVYSVVSAVLWRDLPFRDSTRVVRVFEVGPGPDGDAVYATPTNFLEWQRQTKTLDALVATGSRWFALTGDAGLERITTMMVSSDFLSVVGARVALGRGFLSDDYNQSPSPESARGVTTPRVLILSHELWRRQFAGRPDVVGQRVTLDGNPAEVIGVMEPSPPLLARRDDWGEPDAWVPIEIDAEQTRARYVPVFGRLAEATTLEQAQAEFDLIAAQRAEADPRANKGFGVRLVPLLDSVVEDVRTQLLFLAGAVLAVLLVACANLTTLLLVNASGRRDELATRVALGATRTQLVRQTLTESLVLSAAGGALGVLLALAGVPLLVAAAPPGVPRLDEISLDARVLAMAASASALVGVVCGLGACLSIDRVSCTSVSRVVIGQATRRRRALRQSLAAAEIGGALMLIVAAGLMVRTVRALGTVDLGFDPSRVMTVHLDGLEAAELSTSDRQASFARRVRVEAEILERVRALPGVLSAGIGSGPLSGGGMGTVVELPGREAGQKPESLFIGTDSISRGYFEALGARLLSGRLFEDADVTRTPQPVIVNASLARVLWGDRNPVGERTRLNGRDTEVVGVVADMRRIGLEAPPAPAVYFNHTHRSGFMANNMLVRTAGDPLALGPQIRSIATDVQDALSRTPIETLQERIDRATAPRRFMLGMVGGFSLLALALALVGIYGILAESVAQRVPEIGVRMALGATPGNVTQLFLRQGAWIIAIGLVLGLAGAFGLHRTMATLVFGVETLDPPAFIAAVLCLLVTATVACAVPARRAARLDPVAALRQE